ncbi:MAG: 30S ribosomal protein S13 [Candidatus Methanomethylicia archaeon]|uniref:Small ribosomal subunit protein uS13 n=1 Tax=Thermoproteota archaeon TaxID=2056631 RepID=A0A523BFM1_9CREN|nr:30S ribosomal protein S13 [Candidatus Methanomethylicia archaeon]MCQ5374870.1 30S ribosomal protein S13 [Candidatus Methanomethylicia archaeon]TDA39743.1 MAG: 30S ribosomal protein S13 [Candidatus Verstraetearchaeota archaeon]
MSSSYRHIVRIVDTDLKGEDKVGYALARIRGIGINISYAILRSCNVDPETRVGQLQDSDIKRIEEALSTIPARFPPYMLNRRNDPFTGKDLHLMGSDLVIGMKMDIDHMKKIKCWKGIRHSLGLKVRGQCTRTTGRFGTAVGVVRKAVAQQQQQQQQKKE